MLELLVIRHAIAVEREVWARDHLDDEARPLTDEGRGKMAEATEGLARIAPKVSTLASSPLVRAVQTADIVAVALAPAGRVVTETLVPNAPFTDFQKWLRSRGTDGAVAIVGHEPHLGALTSWLLDSAAQPFLEYKKGGAALLEFRGDVRAGAAVLRWLLTPSYLRRIGR
ncbi:MAG: histidine phosphatase family protein [Gemmatimonadota bacterium]|nr:histidine phosphatase family protein [Gemmatimonadota bacterium]